MGVAELDVLYQRVRGEVEAAGIPAEAIGIPLDVQASAAAGWGGPAERAAANNDRAAEHGRGAQ